MAGAQAATRRFFYAAIPLDNGCLWGLTCRYGIRGVSVGEGDAAAGGLTRTKMRTTQRCNNRAYYARISRHSPERRKGVTPARIPRVLRAVFATSFLSGVCCVTARRTRVFTAVFATPFVRRRECRVGVCPRVFRAYFATCPPDAANATRRLGEGGCDAAVIVPAAEAANVTLV